MPRCVDEGFPVDEEVIVILRQAASLKLRGLTTRFSGETTRHRGRALGGCNNITPRKKMNASELCRRGRVLTRIAGQKKEELKESDILLTVR